MKKILIVLLFIASPLQAEKIEQLSWYNLQELLEDDKLTYKIIKSCVSLNSAITELIKEEHPDLANEFFKSANYLYPFGILIEMERECLSGVGDIPTRTQVADDLTGVDVVVLHHLVVELGVGDHTGKR